MKWLEILKVIGPSILSLIPGVAPAIIPVVVHGIETAEATMKSGADKKAAVISIANDAVTVTNSVAKKEVIGPEVISAVSNGIDAVISSVNAIKNKQ